MSKRQVADLHARLTADVTQYDAEMKRASAVTRNTQQQVNRSFAEIQKGGKQFATAFASASIIAVMLRSHVMGVIRDIDNIPGLNPEVVNTINSAKAGMNEFSGEIRTATANIISFAVKAAQGLGLLAGAAVYGVDAARDGVVRLQESGRDYYKTTAAYQDALKKSSQELARAQGKLVDVTGTPGEAADRKMKEAIASHEAAKGIADELEQRLAMVAAYNLEADATKELHTIINRLIKAESDAGKALQPITGASLKGKEAIDALKASISRLQYEIAKVDQSTGAGMEKATELWAEMKVNAEELNKLMDATPAKQFEKAMVDMWNTVSDRAGQAFADMVINGENSFRSLVDIVARSVLEITARMAVINPLLNMVFGATSGWSALPSFFGKPAADGGFRDGSQPYLVGERGPEIFNPGRAGTIIPNDKLGAAGGSASIVYNIDARGASLGVVEEIKRALAMVNGSIEKRALSAVITAKTRGGGLGRALA